jgi:NmrA-like family
MTTNNTLILVGGTGGLGMKIAKGLATAEGFGEKKAIVRDAAKGKELEAMGWTLVPVADFMDGAALEAAFVGAKTVVSTFGGADLVALEKATVTAAKKAGASLFVPSQFGVDCRRWPNLHPFLAAKQQVLEAAKETELPVLAVYAGYFSDNHFGFVADPVNGKARVVGDGSALTSFTLRSDIGYVLAKALADPAYSQGGFLSISGETVSWKDALSYLETALGKKLDNEYIDPEAALEQENALIAKGFQGDMGALVGSFILHLIGEPARGATGSDVSAEAVSYGLSLETLKETAQKMYGAK